MRFKTSPVSLALSYLLNSSRELVCLPQTPAKSYYRPLLTSVGGHSPANVPSLVCSETCRETLLNLAVSDLGTDSSKTCLLRVNLPWKVADMNSRTSFLAAPITAAPSVLYRR
ncbi:uncharacterized protein LOC111298173 [Durio zibethinus]|uniref:Uncharacterized protein LOC111298173 n=1 Tax=Durio zibethinus TaxID=66656 RepID=A0A6P5Z7B4_DURZI|nr:uncharacterized protein LOC111298173 [Durio zibethinus]